MKCWLWHRWGKWVDVARYKHERINKDFGAGIISGVPYFIEAGFTLCQHRVCLDCGKKESREIPA